MKTYNRPLLVAGHGIRLAKAEEELLNVLDTLKLPVVATFNGFDLIPSSHPCFVGRIGTVGTPGGKNALLKCDLLICVGTRNNIRQISYKPETFAPQAKKIIVDIDKNELDKLTVDGLKLCMDAKKYLKMMLECLFDIDKNWLSELRQFNEDHPVKLSTPYKFMHDLTTLLSEGAVVVCGNGTACVCMYQAGIVKKGQRIFWNSGTASMGYDLPAAIGACFANDEKEVICVTGEGSLQMNIQELQTIKHYNLPIKIFVLNNDGYHSIKMTQDNYFNSDYIGCGASSGVSFPNLSDIASAYGFRYFDTTITPIGEVLRHKGACVVEIFIGDDYKIEPKWTGGYDV